MSLAINTICIQYHKTDIGELILGSHQERLCLLDYRYRRMRDAVNSRIQQGLQARFIDTSSDCIEQAKLQIAEYLQNRRTVFDMPITTVGSPFQKSVWQVLQTIPFGQTATYGELAQKLGNPKAVRAVANANGANALALLIPCHRIIGSDGSLVGYAGGLAAKQKLLTIEQAASQRSLF